jgi:hypothetical protein
MKAEKAEKVNKAKSNKDKDEHGYWMYSDGYSYWGIGLYRIDVNAPVDPNNNGTKFELPLKIDTPEPEKIHNGTVEERLEWYREKDPKPKKEKTEETEKVA